MMGPRGDSGARDNKRVRTGHHADFHGPGRRALTGVRATDVADSGQASAQGLIQVFD